MALPLIIVLLCQTVSALRTGSKKNAVGEVVDLLQHLAEQAADEGAKEAAQYDKFACFCKAQGDLKSKNIAKSEEAIASLDATITDLTASLGVLSNDITTLGKRITEIEGEVETEKETRKTEREQWEKDDKEMADAIDATRRAMEALRDSKSKMKGAKLNGGDFLQVPASVQAAVSSLVGLSSVQAALLPRDLSGLTALVQATQMPEDPGKAPKYQYQSNEILELLANLLTDFKQKRQDFWDTEYAARTASDKKVLDLENEKKFKEESKEKKEAISAAKEEDKAEAEKAKTEEEDAKTSDEEFRTELKTQCEQKATDWDQRSQMRAKEIAMMHEAAVMIKTSVLPMYEQSVDANTEKRLTSLAKVSSHVVSKARVVSFLQQSQQHSNTAAQVVTKAVQLLDQQAKVLKSPMLVALASKVDLNKDHFVKVRSLINDLITRLEDMAKEEATHKSFCDQKMEAAVKERDTQAADKETHAATISKKEAEKRELLDEISILSQEVADLTKALNERTELRSEEKLANDKAVADAKAGQAAIAKSIKIIKDFYAFVQYKPPNSDRDGKTVGDLAPETWDGEYKGNKAAGDGVVGLLEIIEADFARTEKEVMQNEVDADKAFADFKKETEASITTKTTDKTTKATEVETAESDIITAKDSLKDADDLHAKALEELEKLSAMCVESEETWEERKAARDREIAALREAMEILDNYNQ